MNLLRLGGVISHKDYYAVQGIAETEHHQAISYLISVY